MQIEGYENYLIFEDGMIINSKTGREMKPFMNTSGYCAIGLTKNLKETKFLVSRLVAKAYIPNPENKLEVDHINRIRNDNRVENLRWTSHIENMQNLSLYKTNTTGEKNIRKTKKGKYRFEKIIYKKTFSKCFHTLQEAIIFRDNYLSNN
tara:strand:- start:246 stop:695 length:450 start_codon:yes stop_codon:yes gene_type:complete